MSVTRTTSALRTAALISLGAFAVHQLRYLAGAGVPQGHSYLGSVLPVLIVVAASSVLSATIAALSTGSTSGRSTGWAWCTTALVAIFAVQETAEGEPAFGHGGWIALPIAIVVGRIVSLLLVALKSVERRLVAVRPSAMPRAPTVVGRARLCQARALIREPLAFGLARRPPPFASV